MKIAVYGHSFAAKNLLSPHPAWFDIVGEKLGATSVLALGKAGAPVFFTYQKFLEVYKKFDLNIFLNILTTFMSSRSFSLMIIFLKSILKCFLNLL